MSMIKCTECGKEISDKATACPHCGCPMTEILSATKENKKEEKVKPIKEKKIKEPITPEQKKKRILIMSVTAFVLFAAVALIWYFGIKIPKVPQEVPVAKAKMQATINIIAGKNFANPEAA